MTIVFSDLVKAATKWTLTVLVFGISVWGICEVLKPCPDCHGNPDSCLKCGGSGKSRVTSDSTCSDCNEKGKKWGIFGTCKSCKGKGFTTKTTIVECGLCGGLGHIKCKTCQK